MNSPISFHSPYKSDLFSDKKRDLRLIASGFPAASDDYADKGMNLHEHIVKNAASTFFMRVSGNDFSDQKVFSGDLLVVDRSLSIEKGSLVVVSFNGGLHLDRFLCIKPLPQLQFIRPFPSESNSFSIWGVVTFIIQNVYQPQE
jgi:DNA polymerase V